MHHLSSIGTMPQPALTVDDVKIQFGSASRELKVAVTEHQKYEVASSLFDKYQEITTMVNFTRDNDDNVKDLMMEWTGTVRKLVKEWEMQKKEMSTKILNLESDLADAHLDLSDAHSEMDRLRLDMDRLRLENALLKEQHIRDQEQIRELKFKSSYDAKIKEIEDMERNDENQSGDRNAVVIE